ncbi:MAG: hypothetical protein LBT70_04370 [Holosporaceae bacterium]|jgi:hypothetical protein|nr:hypothetical protein [Holosporaceae bacterium]
MKKVLFYASLAILSNASAEEYSESSSGESPGTEYAGIGTYVGVGVSLSHQHSLCDENRGFSGASTEINSTPFGASVVVGHNYKFCDDFSVGMELGADFGSSGKKHGIGNIFSQESARFSQMARDVNTVFVNIGRNLEKAATDAGGTGAVVNGSVYANFVNTMKYIGGDKNAALDNSFITKSAAEDGLFSAPPISDATFSNFTTAEYNALGILGGPNPGSIDLLREFITTYHPNLATILRSLQGNDGTDLTAENAANLSYFFENEDIDANSTSLEALLPGNNGNIASAREDLSNYVHHISGVVNNGSASFGVCPHLALKVGAHFSKIKSSLHLKAGLAYLSGKVAFDSGISNKSFGKIAPMVGIEVNRQICNNWGVGLELSHTFGSSKKFEPVKLLGTSIEPKVKLNRTTLKVMATYHIKNCF